MLLERQQEFLVIGGGVAGSTCAVEMKRLCATSKVTLVCPSSVLKTARSVEQITPRTFMVDVQESAAAAFSATHPEITLVCDTVISVDAVQQRASLASGGSIRFDRCCIATGASPLIAADHPRVLGIRDTESVERLNKRLTDARRVLIVGNGGIALELVHSLTSAKLCQVAWAIRDEYVGNTFFDATASAFILPTLSSLYKTEGTCGEKQPEAVSPSISDGRMPLGAEMCSTTLLEAEEREKASYKNHPSSHLRCPARGNDRVVQHKASVKGLRSNESLGIPERAGQRTVCGSSLGPDWMETVNVDQRVGLSDAGTTVRTRNSDIGAHGTLLDIHFDCELEKVVDGEGMAAGLEENRWPIWAHLTNGSILGCDFVVSATGVVPNTDVLGAEFMRGDDGGLIVDSFMRVARSDSVATGTSATQSAASEAAIPGKHSSQDVIYAAGDCCILDWGGKEHPHWFQMRLWSQARAMALYAAKCMTDSVDELGAAGAFDLFVHATRFFGYKVVLLGDFNGQRLESSVRDLVRKRLLLDPTDRHEIRDLHSESGVGVTKDVQVLLRVTPGVEYVKTVQE